MSLQGHLKDLSLSDLFQIITLSKRTGVLNITGLGAGRIDFRYGHILYASVYNKEKLGERLIRMRLIREAELLDALKIQSERRVYEPLGTILAESKAVPQETLERVIQEQIEEVVQELLHWDQGEFRFEEEPSFSTPLESRNLGVLLGKGLSTEYLILEGARLQDERANGFSNDERERNLPLWNRSMRPPDGPPNSFVSMLKELMASRDFSEVVLSVLRYSSDFLQRALVLTVQGNHLLTFGQSGFRVPSVEMSVRRIKIPLGRSTLFDSALRDGFYRGPLSDSEWDQYLKVQFDGDCPREVVIAPLMGPEGVSAFLYGDDFPDRQGIGVTEALEVFLQAANLVSLRLSSREKSPIMRTVTLGSS